MTRDGSTDEPTPPGEHVTAAHVARRLGRHVRTIRGWILTRPNFGVAMPSGKHVRWFVFRSAFEALLPKKEESTDAHASK